MFFLKAAYCRIFQGAFRLALPVLPYREPEIINCCADLVPVMEKEHIRCPLIVTDQGIVEHGLVAPLTDILERPGLRFGIYDRTQPNPTVDNKEDIPLLARHAEKEANPLYPVPVVWGKKDFRRFIESIRK